MGGTLGCSLLYDRHISDLLWFANAIQYSYAMDNPEAHWPPEETRRDVLRAILGCYRALFLRVFEVAV